MAETVTQYGDQGGSLTGAEVTSSETLASSVDPALANFVLRAAAAPENDDNFGSR